MGDEERKTIINRVTAISDISSGTEIRISYIASKQINGFTVGERRRFLKEHWGFDCDCPLCESEVGSLTESVSADGVPADEYVTVCGNHDDAMGCGSSDEGVCWDDLCDPDA